MTGRVSIDFPIKYQFRSISNRVLLSMLRRATNGKRMEFWRASHLKTLQTGSGAVPRLHVFTSATAQAPPGPPVKGKSRFLLRYLDYLERNNYWLAVVNDERVSPRVV